MQRALHGNALTIEKTSARDIIDIIISITFPTTKDKKLISLLQNTSLDNVIVRVYEFYLGKTINCEIPIANLTTKNA